jgi:mannose-6-phosphate isomerase-like protein (cupin superfamily)
MIERGARVARISLGEEVAKIDKPWSPVEVARANDQVIRLAKIEGEYHWHKHSNEDELFYVLQGSIVIQLKDQSDVMLDEGEMAVVPKGVEHCPKSEGFSYILMFEPYSLKSAGDEGGGPVAPAVR